MLEVTNGKAVHPQQVANARDAIRASGLSGNLFIGYPVLASMDDTLFLDAVLISKEHGMVLLDASDDPPMRTSEHEKWERLAARQDELAFAMTATLSRNKDLRRGRELGLKVHVVSILPSTIKPPRKFNVLAAAATDIPKLIRELPPLELNLWRAANAAIQRVSTIKPAIKRTEVSRDDSRGAKLKSIEREIANLDQWQKRAAIESPEGPQRIRGLAGSGKTIVLALKAAYLHVQHPEWKIAITFFTRSLYQQFKDLIRRFTFEHTNDEPDWSRIHLLHAWGSYDRRGFYTEVAERIGAPVRNWTYAKAIYGRSLAFKGICTELLTHLDSGDVVPIYDAILIDEAQDLPTPFFRIARHMCKEPHRLIWAYDELQNLGDFAVEPIQDLFGRDTNGAPHVVLQNREDEPHQDVILRTCYRNTPWALVVAHALGFGIYRSQKRLVQFFDEPQLWEDIGYEIVKGEIKPGQKVVLRRRRDSYPPYFADLLKAEDAVSCHVFSSPDEQAQWVAEQIHVNVTVDELRPTDVMIILPEAFSAGGEGLRVVRALEKKGMTAHIAGSTSSQDELFLHNSVAISHIHRAKGNEAPMVYVLNSDYCLSGPELIQKRNALFTAITRSRAWVRICGIGSAMKELEKEVKAVKDHQYELSFNVPTAEEIKRLRTIHRDMTEAERVKVRKVEKNVEDALRILEEMDPAALPEELLEKIKRLGGFNIKDGADETT